MPSLGEAILYFKADKSGLDKGFSDSEKEAESFTGRIGNTIAGGLKTAFAVGGAAVVTGIVGIGVAAFGAASDMQGASGQMQAALGLTKDEADKLSDTALNIFGNNFGTSMQDASDSLITVRQQMKGLADEELQSATENALRLRDVFQIDVAESTNAANTLMSEFGLTSQEAFDFIAAGNQKGLNTSGDFLETIGEYSVQFAESGATADQFFSTLETGMAGGVLGTDKIADAFKENRIRIMEMGDDATEALYSIGAAGPGQRLADSFGVVGPFIIDTEEKAKAAQAELAKMGINRNLDDLMRPLTNINEKTGEITVTANTFASEYSSGILKGITDGSITVTESQQLIIDGMNEMDNKVWQNTAGVALFGTQWEDAGADAILGINASKTGMADLAGSTDTLNAKYNSLGGLVSGTWRKIQVEVLKPIGDVLLNVANAVLPLVTAGIQKVTAAFSEGGGLAGVVTTLQAVFSGFATFFQQHGDQILAVFTTTWAAIQTLIDLVLPPIQAVFMTIFGAVKTFIDEHGASILATLTNVWNTISEVVTQAVTFIQTYIVPILTAIAGFIAEHSDQILGIISGVWTAISGVVNGAMDVIKGIINTVMAILSGDWSAAWDGIKQVFGGVWTAIEGIVTGVLAVIGNAIQIAWDNIAVVFNVAWTGIKTVFTTVWDAIYLVVSTGLETIWTAITTVWDSVTLFFSDTWTGIKNTFTDTWTALKKAVDDVLGPIQVAIETAWGAVATTTSTIFNGIKDTIGGIWTGILDGLKAPINAAIEAVNLLIRGASAVGEALGFEKIPEIPKLAKGSANFKGGLFFGGDGAGPEQYRTPGGEMGVLTGGLYSAPRGTEVLPNGQSFGGGGAATIIIPITINGNVDQGVADTLQQQITAQIESVLDKYVNQASLLAN